MLLLLCLKLINESQFNTIQIEVVRCSATHRITDTKLLYILNDTGYKFIIYCAGTDPGRRYLETLMEISTLRRIVGISEGKMDQRFI